MGSSDTGCTTALRLLVQLLLLVPPSVASLLPANLTTAPPTALNLSLTLLGRSHLSEADRGCLQGLATLPVSLLGMTDPVVLSLGNWEHSAIVILGQLPVDQPQVDAPSSTLPPRLPLSPLASYTERDGSVYTTGITWMPLDDRDALVDPSSASSATPVTLARLLQFTLSGDVAFVYRLVATAPPNETIDTATLHLRRVDTLAVPPDLTHPLGVTTIPVSPTLALPPTLDRSVVSSLSVVYACVDGSDLLTFLSPSLAFLGSLRLRLNNRPFLGVSEVEWIQRAVNDSSGDLWLMTDDHEYAFLAALDTGVVHSSLSLAGPATISADPGLHSTTPCGRPHASGVAYSVRTNRLWFGGRYWKWLFEGATLQSERDRTRAGVTTSSAPPSPLSSSGDDRTWFTGGGGILRVRDAGTATAGRASDSTATATTISLVGGACLVLALAAVGCRRRQSTQQPHNLSKE
mmetsp:Transcript_16469/g.51501  ORF Transcript_16469/g.51501 Transcript_16469/m.51501 type:complete len:462 (-) Transcript_16469:473-1858(-)